MSLLRLIKSKSFIRFCSNTSSRLVYSLLQSSWSFSTSLMLYFLNDNIDTSYFVSKFYSPICLKLGNSVFISLSNVFGLSLKYFSSTWLANYLRYNLWKLWIRSFFSLKMLSYFWSYSLYWLLIVSSLFCFSDSFTSISLYRISFASMFFFFSFSSFLSNSCKVSF